MGHLKKKHFFDFLVEKSFFVNLDLKVRLTFIRGTPPFARFFSFGRLPLDGSHEPTVVITKEKVRESHRVALLMPKVVFRTPSRYKHWSALLVGHDTTPRTPRRSNADWASGPGLY